MGRAGQRLEQAAKQQRRAYLAANRVPSSASGPSWRSSSPPGASRRSSSTDPSGGDSWSEGWPPRRSDPGVRRGDRIGLVFVLSRRFGRAEHRHVVTAPGPARVDGRPRRRLRPPQRRPRGRRTGRDLRRRVEDDGGKVGLARPAASPRSRRRSARPGPAAKIRSLLHEVGDLPVLPVLICWGAGVADPRQLVPSHWPRSGPITLANDSRPTLIGMLDQAGLR